jgi:hypothetical protein
MSCVTPDYRFNIQPPTRRRSMRLPLFGALALVGFCAVFAALQLRVDAAPEQPAPASTGALLDQGDL